MARPTKEQLQKYLDLKAHKRELEAEARALEPEIDAIADAIESHLDRLGKEACKLAGFAVAREEGRASVKWQAEFSRVAGPEAVAEVLANAPRGTKLSVVSLAAAAAA